MNTNRTEFPGQTLLADLNPEAHEFGKKASSELPQHVFFRAPSIVEEMFGNLLVVKSSKSFKPDRAEAEIARA